MSLAAKLLEVQKEIGTVKKGTINPFFKSKYIDINGVLEVLNPALQKRGILLTQPLTTVGDLPAIRTTFTDVETGETLTDVAVIPSSVKPQDAGSNITYFRRYSLISYIGLGAEDDDANLASGKKQSPVQAAKKTTTNNFGM